MTIQEAQELLPFYVNGTLDPADRTKIEVLLKDSPELRKELRFWQVAAAATRVARAYETEGHPGSRQIVDYAEGNIRDAATRLSVEKHIQQCDDCREEVELVRESTAKPLREKSLAEKFRDFVGQYKLNYFVPVVAVATLVFIILNIRRDSVPERPKEDTVAVEQKPVTISDIVQQIMPSERTASLVLEYTTQTRGRESPQGTPVLQPDSGVTNVNLTLLIPHNRLRDIRYAITLQREGGKNTVWFDEYDLFKGREMDSLSIICPKRPFEEAAGSYEILVKEILPKEYTDLIPETYRFGFVTQDRK